ncbi:phosphoribosyltransferase family protein [Spirosoma litoris]
MDLTLIGLIMAVIAFIFGIPGNLKGLIDLTNHLKDSRKDKYSEKVGKTDAKKLLESYPLQELNGMDASNESQLIEILSNNLYISDKGYVRTGIVSNIGCSIFLDIFSPSTILNNRGLMAKAMADKVLEIERTTKKKIDIIAVPKMGNVLLADQVAQIVNKPIVIVRLTNAIRFGYPFEGYPQSGQNCIIIDDVASDGNFLGACVTKLRQYGVKVHNCLCLYQRTDGDALKELTTKNVKLHYFFSLDDNHLSNYINKNDDRK